MYTTSYNIKSSGKEILNIKFFHNDDKYIFIHITWTKTQMTKIYHVISPYLFKKQSTEWFLDSPTFQDYTVSIVSKTKFKWAK